MTTAIILRKYQDIIEGNSEGNIEEVEESVQLTPYLNNVQVLRKYQDILMEKPFTVNTSVWRPITDEGVFFSVNHDDNTVSIKSQRTGKIYTGPFNSKMGTQGARDDLQLQMWKDEGGINVSPSESTAQSEPDPPDELTDLYVDYTEDDYYKNLSGKLGDVHGNRIFINDKWRTFDEFEKIRDQNVAAVYDQDKGNLPVQPSTQTARVSANPPQDYWADLVNNKPNLDTEYQQQKRAAAKQRMLDFSKIRAKIDRQQTGANSNSALDGKRTRGLHPTNSVNDSDETVNQHPGLTRQPNQRTNRNTTRLPLSPHHNVIRFKKSNRYRQTPTTTDNKKAQSQGHRFRGNLTANQTAALQQTQDDLRKKTHQTKLNKKALQQLRTKTTAQEFFQNDNKSSNNSESSSQIT